MPSSVYIAILIRSAGRPILNHGVVRGGGGGGGERERERERERETDRQTDSDSALFIK